MLKLKILKFQNRMKTLIDDLNDWWTEISLAEPPYNFNEYSKRIDGFIQDLEDLRNKKTISNN